MKTLSVLLLLLSYSVYIWADTHSIGFEEELNIYTDWSFTNISSKNCSDNVGAHSGSYYGKTTSAIASIVTSTPIARPTNLTFFISKQTANSTESDWKIQVSSDKSNWNTIRTQSAISMNQGEWVEVTQDLSAFPNVYVRIFYSGSSAVRCIDDISLTTVSTNQSVSHTITWSINGNTSIIEASSVADGTEIEFPSDLSDILGKKFVGWTANPSANSQNDIVSGNVFADADATYYAVFAEYCPENSETARLTVTDNTGTTYTNGLTRTDNHGNNWVSYANIARDVSDISNPFYLHITKNSNGYHIGSPIFDNNIINIRAKVWNINDSECLVYLMANTYLTQPTISDYGTTVINGTSLGVELELTINPSVEFRQFFIYSSGSVGFEWIEVTYGVPESYSNYSTVVETQDEIEVSSAQYATYFNADQAFIMPAGLEGMVVSSLSGDALALHVAYHEGDAVPAGEPLILHATVALPESRRFGLEYTNTTNESLKSEGSNLLSGTSSSTELTTGGDIFYRLSVHEGQVGFYYGAEGGAAFCPGAHKAYLAINSAAQHAPVSFLINVESNELTAAEDVTPPPPRIIPTNSLKTDACLYVKMAMFMHLPGCSSNNRLLHRHSMEKKYFDPPFLSIIVLPRDVISTSNQEEGNLLYYNYYYSDEKTL